jgi:hypothetical protein
MPASTREKTNREGKGIRRDREPVANERVF